MLFIPAEHNTLAPGVAELHLSIADYVTIILPQGDEIYVDGDGHVSTGDGRTLRNG